MRAADDFDYIYRRIIDLRDGRKIDPATCTRHSFDPVNNRCIYCNLHYYHLPALENCRPADAGTASDRDSADSPASMS